MGYATVQDMIDEFGETELAQVSDRSLQAVAVNTVIVQKKLDDADAEIDSYLGVRYALPLPSIPPVLKRTACDIARYHLYDDRATERVIERYKYAIDWLKNVAKGIAQLGVDPLASDAPAQVGGEPHVDAADPVWSRDTLKDFNS